MRCYPRILALLHTQHSLTHRAAPTVGGSLSCSSYQGHGSGEKLQDPRRVNTFLWIKSIRKQCDQKNGEKMFSFYAIWFGLYRIYTFGVSYLFLMVVLHLGSMDVVCTSPLGGLACPRLQPAASERQWPFWRQSFLFLLSPHNKLVSSEEWPRHSDSHTHPGAGMGGDGLLPPDPQALLPLSHWKDAARRPLLLLLGASFPRCCSWETFWKLFGNKKQTQDSVVRWGCDLSPSETWVPSRARGWWSLPRQHQVFQCHRTQWHVGVTSRWCLERSAARCTGPGLGESASFSCISTLLQGQ